MRLHQNAHKKRGRKGLVSAAELIGKTGSADGVNELVIVQGDDHFHGHVGGKHGVGQLAAEEERIAELARTMPITSGANFEGYRIVRYAGYVSGDEVATIPMGFFSGSITNDAVNETIKSVRNIAINELKEAAANLDCNGVIGLDFDYITIDRSNANGTVEVKIVLTANGTAVEIEPL